MLSTETEDGIIQLVEGLTGLMQFKLNASLYATEGQIEINLTGGDRAYLITDNGETLLSMQYILARVMVSVFRKRKNCTSCWTMTDTCSATKRSCGTWRIAPCSAPAANADASRFRR